MIRPEDLDPDGPIAALQLKERVLQRIEVAGREVVPVGLVLRDPEILVDVMTDSLLIQLRGFVLGERGERATDRREVVVPSFPRWIPKWLRRRWTKVEAVTLSATPLLVWPDATIRTPELGSPVRLVQLG